MVCFAQMIGQDVCVSCTYAVLLHRQKYPKSPGKRCGKVAEVTSLRCPKPPARCRSRAFDRCTFPCSLLLPPAALAGKAPDPAAGNKKPLPSGRGGSRQADGEGVGADSISARARLPPRGSCQRS